MPQYLAEFDCVEDKKPYKEYATFTTGNFILEDPGCPDSERQFFFQQLEEVAEQIYHFTATLAVIYRAVTVLAEEIPQKNDRLVFCLKPVFRFDENGENPILVP
jgi:hypothetical protein